MEAKLGNFDWIVSYDNVKEYFHHNWTGIQLHTTESKLLVIGCGTSPMSSEISKDFNLCKIVSIDNDEGCVNHMIELYAKQERMKWYRYDIIEDYGVLQFNELDIDGYFDIVVDKGTFDAILVEGSTHVMLRNVVRMLRVGGIYMLFSINLKSLLSSILGLDGLNFALTFHEDVENNFTIAICKKLSNDIADSNTLALEEKIVMDNYFQTEKPLLTPYLKDLLRNEFESKSTDKDCYLSLYDAHQIMFVSNNKHLCYDFQLFLEDIQNIVLTRSDYISYDESVYFLSVMQ